MGPWGEGYKTHKRRKKKKNARVHTHTHARTSQWAVAQAPPSIVHVALHGVLCAVQGDNGHPRGGVNHFKVRGIPPLGGDGGEGERGVRVGRATEGGGGEVAGVGGATPKKTPTTMVNPGHRDCYGGGEVGGYNRGTPHVTGHTRGQTEQQGC